MSRVALIGENSVEYVDKLLDIWYNGDCAVLIDWRIPFPTAVEMMKDANVSKCFIDEYFYEKLPIELNEIEFVSFKRCNNVAELLPDDVYEKFKPNYSKTEAIVIYSSGTTGKSKGVILSHYAINTNADAIIDYMNPSSNDCISIVKTLSHSSTITGELLVALKTKMSLVIAPIIVPPRYILNNIEKFEVTILCVNPTLLSLLSDEMNRAMYKLKTMRTIYVSGSILGDTVYAKAHTVFYDIPIYNVYGLSEAGPRVTAQSTDCCKSNSVGKPIKGVEMVIVDDEGVPVSDGKCGIIHVNTSSRCIGYVSGSEKYKTIYKNWLNTGDIGYLDANDELHVVSRIDDVIIVDSHKVNPSDVEKQICEIDGIKECVVVKVEYANAGLIACLYTGENWGEVAVRNVLRDKLMPYEIPKRFIWVQSIPQTLNGKISVDDVRKTITQEMNKEKSYEK